MKNIIILLILALSCTVTAQDIRYNGKPWGPRNGLIGWWPMSEGSGTSLSDISGNANTATLNADSWGTGKFKSSISNTYATFAEPSNFKGLSALTVTAWLYKTNNGTPSIIASWNSQARFLIRGASGSPNMIQFYLTASSAVSHNTSNITDGWRFLAFVYNGSNITTYVDGNNVIGGPTNVTGSLSGANTNTIYINSDYDTNPTNFGRLEDLRVYNRALSTDEITEMYQRSK